MRRATVVAGLFAALLVAALPAAGASAGGAQSSVVSADPVDWTPNVLDGTVYAVAVVGDEAIVGGDFHRVRSADGDIELTRSGLFAFQLGTGAISASFDPQPNGTVRALAAGPDGTVYVGGSFTELAGGAHHGLARLSVTDGTATAGFTAGIDTGTVLTLATDGSGLYAGGTFGAVGGTARPALARLSTRTGAVDTGFDAAVAQQRSGRLRVSRLALSGTGALGIIGTFTQVGGQSRNQLAVVSAGTGAVRNWYTDAYRPQCNEAYNSYLRDIDFAPDGSSFVVVSTGHQAGPKAMCNSAAKFELAGAGRHHPAWVNRTGGNTLLSVACTGAAVYVGGHQQWLDNPYGDKSAGAGAVSRPGIGAIDPATGKALGWNPTHDRGNGVDVLRTYPAGTGHPGGLLVGSDTEHMGHEYHARIGAFPLS
ncbi:hypothetical protein Athai_19520 [Actinocatenispora thailandica]|uniref:PKD domain containing protein n=1 Tax=Actinocatenispora thailandica TaxID=227318 RepID=A0A7R7DMG1_9ACTN|nr:PKD domain containing protein [Actinocatenispora thailandica]BCJ34449.1 hypothetical protein Athai_19520 [Actinocatenispora thailandica]